MGCRTSFTPSSPETPPGAKSVLSFEQYEWKLMADQNPHSGLTTPDSGHETMTFTSEMELSNDDEELVGATGGAKEAATGEFGEDIMAEPLSDVSWREEDLHIPIEDENVTTPE